MVSKGSPPPSHSSILYQFINSDSITSQIGNQHFDIYQSDLSGNTSTSTTYQPHGGLSRSMEFVNPPHFTTDVNHSRHLMDLLGASHDATNQQAQRLSLSLSSHSLVSSFGNPSYMSQEIDQRNNEFSFSAAAAMNQSFSTVCGTESFVSVIGNSRYLKPTQSLLEELVCIGGKPIDSSNEKFIRRLSRNSKKGSLSLRAMLKGEIPPSNGSFNERHELYVKIMKLIALLEEVCKNNTLILDYFILSKSLKGSFGRMYLVPVLVMILFNPLFGRIFRRCITT